MLFLHAFLERAQAKGSGNLLSVAKLQQGHSWLSLDHCLGSLH